MFKKGKSGNPKGRPKTSYSIKLRQLITEFCEENAQDFFNDLKRMRPGHAKAQAFIGLLNYCLPRLTEANSTIDIENLSDEEIDKLLNRITRPDK